MTTHLRLMETVIRAFIVTTGFEDFLIAFHNACVHGNVFEERGGITDKNLDKLFKLIEGMQKIAKE